LRGRKRKRRRSRRRRRRSDTEYVAQYEVPIGNIVAT
jgi:hypothetical protein